MIGGQEVTLTLGFSTALALAVVLGASANGPATTPARPRTVDPKPRVITISANENMKYSTSEIVAKRGERLTIALRNAGPKMAMAHNFVLLALGTDALAFSNASALARDDNYIAPAFAKKVLAATPQVNGGETVEVTFIVPKVPGRYDFLCSLPGHFLGGMRGVLVVK